MDEAALAINADVDLPLRGPRQHPDVPLVAILGLVHLRIPIFFLVLVPPAHPGSALVKVELGAAIKVASMLVPCLIVIPLALR